MWRKLTEATCRIGKTNGFRRFTYSGSCHALLHPIALNGALAPLAISPISFINLASGSGGGAALKWAMLHSLGQQIGVTHRSGFLAACHELFPPICPGAVPPIVTTKIYQAGTSWGGLLERLGVFCGLMCWRVILRELCISLIHDS